MIYLLLIIGHIGFILLVWCFVCYLAGMLILLPYFYIYTFLEKIGLIKKPKPKYKFGSWRDKK